MKRLTTWRINDTASWQISTLPGLVVIGLVILARFAGLLQVLEWDALDTLLRLRPAEPLDERIVIIGIHEADIRDIGTYPIPDRDLAILIQQLKTYQPTVISLDLVRDLPVQPGHAELVNVFRETKNLIAIEKALPDRANFTVNPPPNLPPEQIGFADLILDPDGYVRRSLISTPTFQGNYKFSLSIRLAETYLKTRGFSLENGIQDPTAMRFGSTELHRFLPNTGAYIRTDANGNQLLLHFRSGRQPFRIISLSDIKSGNVDSKWLRDRIVLIGATAISARDIINSAAVPATNPGLVYGVELHAHITSQIISAVLDQRPLLNTWAEGWEYLWIVAWGLVGIRLGHAAHSALTAFLSAGLAIVGLLGVCYGLLILGWWVPLVPALLVLTFNAAGLAIALLYQYERDLKARIQERQQIIEHTFEAIHNGPLQTLAGVLRKLQEHDDIQHPLLPEMQHLNQELRSVYESVQRETLTQEHSLYLSSGLKLDLQTPMHTALYEVYLSTLMRDFVHFATIKLKIVKFDPLDSRYLTLEQKRGLCRFLEEALCNVGKYAIGVTRLEVICTQTNGQNLIRITDNGVGIAPAKQSQPNPKIGGRGTRQAQNLAKQLRGTYQRAPNSPKGTICQLTWSATQPWYWQLFRS